MLPKNLLYTSRIESAPAKASRVGIAPQNGTGPYQPNELITINLPTRPNLVLVPSESYLKFSVPGLTAAAATALRLDSAGAHQFIQAIRIYHGSNQLEVIDNYGLLAKMLFDISVPTDAILGKLNVMAGTRGDMAVNFNGVADVVTLPDVNTNYKNSFSVSSVNSGELMKSSTMTNTLAAGTASNPVTFCINLISLLGTLCPNNYFPLFMLSGSPLRLEIQLVDSVIKALNTVTAVNTPSGLVTNVEYVANFIELGDEAMQMITGSLDGGPLQFVFSDYRSYQFSSLLTTNITTQVQFPIGAKFSSLKSLFVTIRDKGIGTLAYFPGSSVGYGLADYQFRVGPNVYPTKPVNTYQEMFAECVKAIGSMSDLNYQPSIDKSSYTMQQSTPNTVAGEFYGASNVSSGSFYIGLDLENYANADKSQIFSGANTNTDDIYCTMNFNLAGSSNPFVGTVAIPTAQVRFDAFALFDSVIVFQNGTAFIRF
jgi:hypothetical protein